MPKRRDHIPSEPPEPAAEYREWTENRYNPGYWASRGKAPPGLKNLWSTKDRRWLGAIYVVGPVLGLILAFLRGVPFNGDKVLPVVLGLDVYVAMGLIMLFSRDDPKQRTKKR